MVLLHLETILSNLLPRSYCLGIETFEGWAVWFMLWLPTLSFPRLIFHSRSWWRLDWVTLCGGAVLGSVGCSAEPLTFASRRPVATPPQPWESTISPDFAKCPPPLLLIWNRNFQGLAQGHALFRLKKTVRARQPSMEFLIRPAEAFAVNASQSNAFLFHLQLLSLPHSHWSKEHTPLHLLLRVASGGTKYATDIVFHQFTAAHFYHKTSKCL